MGIALLGVPAVAGCCNVLEDGCDKGFAIDVGFEEELMIEGWMLLCRSTAARGKCWQGRKKMWRRTLRFIEFEQCRFSITKPPL